MPTAGFEAVWSPSTKTGRGWRSVRVEVHQDDEPADDVRLTKMKQWRAGFSLRDRGEVQP
jgi:hypothetical protein